MIKHEEVRTSLELMRDDVIDFKDNLQLYYEETHSSYSTDEDYNLIKTYIAEQEKKDELLNLYKALHNTYRYPTWNLEEEVKYVLEEIKSLEEELKWTVITQHR